MTGEAHDGGHPDAEWPVALSGVTETVVATLGPNGRWNLAALGVHAGDEADEDDGAGEGNPATARTYGDTRTRRNFERRGGGVVQFVTDPRRFVDAALSVREEAEPVLDSADAWVEVDAEQVAVEREGDTVIRTWELTPVDAGVRRREVRTLDRATLAVVDGTVAASRLDVPGSETDALLDRLAYYASVVETCGGATDREAFARIDEYTGWRDRRNDEDC